MTFYWLVNNVDKKRYVSYLQLAWKPHLLVDFSIWNVCKNNISFIKVGQVHLMVRPNNGPFKTGAANYKKEHRWLKYGREKL